MRIRWRIEKAGLQFLLREGSRDNLETESGVTVDASRLCGIGASLWTWERNPGWLCN